MTPEQDAMLTELAQRWGVSKNEAIVRAVQAVARDDKHSRDVSEISREMTQRWGPVLDRLGSV